MRFTWLRSHDQAVARPDGWTFSTSSCTGALLSVAFGCSSSHDPALEMSSGGAGGKAPVASPCAASGALHVVDLAVGESAAFALLSDGTVWCWGDPYSGLCPSSSQLERPREQGLDCVHALAVTHGRAIAAAEETITTWGGEVIGGPLTVAGEAQWITAVQGLAWGVSPRAWTADGWRDPSRLAPIPFAHDADLAVNGHDFVLFVRRGRVYGVGANERGQLGNGTTAPSEVPLRVDLPRPAIDLALGYKAMALLDDGRLFAGCNSRTDGAIMTAV